MAEIAGDTGRIQKTLEPSARRILFERNLADQFNEELPYLCQIDFAHVLMLGEQNIVEAHAAKQLLRAIRRLTQQKYLPLRSRPAPRGLFLLYETYLIETEGAHVGGLLQTGRSRNDLNATLLRMRLRAPFLELTRAMLRLQAVMMRQSRIYAQTVMPAYTHGQAAEPITYGHYLAGVAEELQRGMAGLIDATRELDVCPLGAGAVAGTSLPINCARTASLLGFSGSCRNSVDAVAARDIPLRMLAAGAIYGATLSRAATDLNQWLTAEFQFLSLPDELVGSSSAMPQKRNPFLLEHIQGRTASAFGCFTHALAATRNAPFSNAIAVGTESVRPLWGALRDMNDATTLMRLVIRHARPCPERMLERASTGFTNATALAVQLIREKRMDFRSAHHSVGQMVSEAIAKDMKSLEELCVANGAGPDIDLAAIDPEACVARNKYGGGPAPEVLQSTLEALRNGWLEQYRAQRDRATQWQSAAQQLAQVVEEFCRS
jgi:argininosuccinate lyase